ncbi:unnamed protein product [marine sediment metagenome]|uniref:Uncharacterized protein n=1 Tax=marine sediment metagenome TaxID=412755 RepID=X1ABM7_9ZZZZ
MPRGFGRGFGFYGPYGRRFPFRGWLGRGIPYTYYNLRWFPGWRGMMSNLGVNPYAMGYPYYGKASAPFYPYTLY